MFQFPPFATYAYEFSTRSFRDPGINTRLTAPPGLSQSSTPFIASWRQDIPHTPLVAWPHWSRPRRAVPREKRTSSSHRPHAALGVGRSNDPSLISKGSFAETHEKRQPPPARAAGSRCSCEATLTATELSRSQPRPRG